MPRVRGGEAVQGPVEYLKKRMRCVFLDADPGVNGRGRACITAFVGGCRHLWGHSESGQVQWGWGMFIRLGFEIALVVLIYWTTAIFPSQQRNLNI